jgi:hypothetical protein
MFYFNTDKFDFWKMYDDIKKYYPIGIRKEEGSIFFFYPGLKELENIIVKNIHDENEFAKWQNFEKEIEQSLQKPVIGTTYGQAPSFSSFIELEKYDVENITITKELHFFVSLVGPYYTILGQDMSFVKIDSRNFISANHLTLSPEEKYSDAFIFLCDNIEKKFPDYRFVPFHIYSQVIEGLDVRYNDEHLNRIFHALFNNQVNFNVQYLGDEFYRHEQWIKEGYIDTGNKWTVYPPQ